MSRTVWQIDVDVDALPSWPDSMIVAVDSNLTFTRQSKIVLPPASVSSPQEAEE